MISNPTIVSAQNNKRPIDPNLLTFYHVVRASSPRFLLTRRIFVSPHTNKLAIRFHWKTSQDAYGHRYPNHFPRYIVCDSTWFTCFFSVSCLYHWTRSVYKKNSIAVSLFLNLVSYYDIWTFVQLLCVWLLAFVYWYRNARQN